MRAPEHEAWGGSHPSAEELAAYLDSGLSQEDAVRVSAHLADCDICRTEIIEVSRLTLAPAARGRSRWTWVGVASAAAAMVLTFRFLSPTAPMPVSFPDGLRSGGMEDPSVGTLSVVQPIPDGAVHGDSLVFVWRAADEEASYRFTLADEAGAPVWSASTRDTMLSLPDDVELASGPYLWRIDALFADGSTATSTVHRLSVVR